MIWEPARLSIIAIPEGYQKFSYLTAGQVIDLQPQLYQANCWISQQATEAMQGHAVAEGIKAVGALVDEACEQSDYVVDTTGWEISVHVMARIKCWPAVPGVTC